MVDYRVMDELLWDYTVFEGAQINGALLGAAPAGSRYVIYSILAGSDPANIIAIESPAGTELIEFMMLAGTTIQLYGRWECPTAAAVVVDSSGAATTLNITLGYKIESVTVLD